MGKIGLVTFFISNYGSVLQAYATKTFLQENGYEPVLLRKDTFGEDPADIEANKLRHPEFYEDFQKFMASLTNNDSLVANRSISLIDDFIRNELSPEGYPMDKLREIALSDEFDAFIVGSDQVWNCTLGMLSPLYFLLFVPPGKRIALAPSFGSNSVPEYLTDDLRNVLNDYAYLSAREDEGVKIIRDITGREVKRLADPTVFLTDDQWREFENADEDRGYLLLHFLNAPNRVALKNIKMIADKTRMRIKCFATGYKEFDDIPGIEHVDGGPRDYVGAIDNAGLVCTDSFHTTMFSINLNTDFYCFDRQYTHGISQVSRITTVLKRYGLMDRLILNDDNSVCTDDFHIHTTYGDIKERERDDLTAYLLDAVQSIVGKLF